MAVALPSNSDDPSVQSYTLYYRQQISRSDWSREETLSGISPFSHSVLLADLLPDTLCQVWYRAHFSGQRISPPGPVASQRTLRTGMSCNCPAIIFISVFLPVECAKPCLNSLDFNFVTVSFVSPAFTNQSSPFRDFVGWGVQCTSSICFHLNPG